MLTTVDSVIVSFCKQITSTTSTNDKKAIIASYSNNQIVKEFLQFMYDKLIVTGISNKKLDKKLKHTVYPVIWPTDILQVILYLKESNTGSDTDIAVCQSYLNYLTCNDSELKILRQIITKTLKLGIDTKLVNTAIPGLIRVHQVQQALALKNVKLKDNEWICLSQKLNGNRATFVDGVLLSRQGKQFNNLQHIIDELNKISEMFAKPYVFDGEIIRKNVDNVSDNQNFTLGTGILNSNVENKTELSFIIFDLLPLTEFREGESTLTYKKRRYMMKALDYNINSLVDTYKHVEVVPFLYEGTDHSQIQACLDKMDIEGKEGCMLARDVTYKCKRHNGLLKVKTFYTMDLPIIGFETGTGKNEGTLGNIIVDYKGNNVGVGSGFSDEQRQWFWEHRGEILGRTVEVRYKDISRDKTTGKESLQFPVFVQLREEGKAVSFN